MVWVQLELTGYNGKLTDELQENFCQAIKKTLSINKCCEYVGITPVTYSNWTRKAKEGGLKNEKYIKFANKVKQALISIEVDLIDDIRASTDWKAKLELLKRIDRLKSSFDICDLDFTLLSLRESNMLSFLIAKARGEKPDPKDYVINNEGQVSHNIKKLIGEG